MESEDTQKWNWLSQKKKRKKEEAAEEEEEEEEEEEGGVWKEFHGSEVTFMGLWQVGMCSTAMC